MTLLAESPLVSRSASGAKVQGEGHAEVNLWYQKEYDDRSMSAEHARLTWHRYLADRTDITSIPIL